MLLQHDAGGAKVCAALGVVAFGAPQVPHLEAPPFHLKRTDRSSFSTLKNGNARFTIAVAVISTLGSTPPPRHKNLRTFPTRSHFLYVTEADKLPWWPLTNTGTRAVPAPEADRPTTHLQIILTEQNSAASLTPGEVRRPWVAPAFVEMDLRTARGTAGHVGSDFNSGG